MHPGCARQRNAVSTAQMLHTEASSHKDMHMTTTSLNAPPPAPAEIGARVLALLTRLHGPNDLAPDAIEHATGVAVRHDPEDAERYGFGLPLEAGWMCHLGTIPNRKGKTPKRLTISFDPDDEADGGLPPSVPALEDFARSLVQAGYRREPLLGPRNVLSGEVFTRDDVEVRVNVECEDPSAERLSLRLTRISVDADINTNTFAGAEDHV